MAVKIIISPGQNSLKFSDRVLNLDSSSPVVIGRAGRITSSSSENGYFDSKVLSKTHALLRVEENKVLIQDSGSSNGTFINNIRLSKPGKESEPVEVFSGDIIKFGSEVEDKNKKVKQKPVVIRATIIVDDKVDTRERSPTSKYFRPAESQEDLTMVADDMEGALSRDSMVMLKKKLLEMQKGMEFLTYKEKDYEELQQLAEEEAETICELEKENFKLKHALNNIEDKISSEKEKYMKLAEYEAETICNLEKENYELINTLNVAEENLQKEQTSNKILQESWQRETKILEDQLKEMSRENHEKSEELLSTKTLLEDMKKKSEDLENENQKLKARVDKDIQLLEATESDYDLLVKADLDTLTESRRHSTAVLEEEQKVENVDNTIGKSGYLQIVVNLDIVLLLIISCVSFMIGFVFNDFSFYLQNVDNTIGKS